MNEIELLNEARKCLTWTPVFEKETNPLKIQDKYIAKKKEGIELLDKAIASLKARREAK